MASLGLNRREGITYVIEETPPRRCPPQKLSIRNQSKTHLIVVNFGLTFQYLWLVTAFLGGGAGELSEYQRPLRVRETEDRMKPRKEK